MAALLPCYPSCACNFKECQFSPVLLLDNFFFSMSLALSSQPTDDFLRASTSDFQVAVLLLSHAICICRLHSSVLPLCSFPISSKYEMGSFKWIPMLFHLASVPWSSSYTSARSSSCSTRSPLILSMIDFTTVHVTEWS